MRLLWCCGRWECKAQASDLCLNDGKKHEIENCENTDGTKVNTKTCRCGTSIINPNSVCAKMTLIFYTILKNALVVEQKSS